MRKKTMFMLLAGFLLSLMLSSVSKAFSGEGSGTEGDPFIITDVNGLQAMSGNLDGWYELGNDIDASATSGWPGGSGFDPIGDWDNKFIGHFDGKGYTITGLYIGENYTDFFGLFGATASGSVIKNVGLMDVDVNVEGQCYSGGLVGCNDGTITDCYSTGSVLGCYDVGGLVGRNINGTITNCYSTSSASGNYGVGGLVGYNINGTITNCYSTGSVTGYNGVSGLVGYNINGTITNCYSMCSVKGYGSVGGPVGYNINGKIPNC